VRSRDINGKYGNPVLWNLRIDSRIRKYRTSMGWGFERERDA
jgi:hypothetical protein